MGRDSRYDDGVVTRGVGKVHDGVEIRTVGVMPELIEPLLYVETPKAHMSASLEFGMNCRRDAEWAEMGEKNLRTYLSLYLPILEDIGSSVFSFQ